MYATPTRPLPVQAKRALIGQLLISAQMRRLRGSTNITGADGSPCGVIEEMMVSIAAVLFDRGRRGSELERST